MYYELSKSQKKIARKVMDIGLDNHNKKNLSDVKTIIQEWDEGKFSTSKEAYMALYQTVTDNDENISRIYDNKSGSRWVEVMAEQLHEGVISSEDLNEIDEEVRNTILRWSGMISLLAKTQSRKVLPFMPLCLYAFTPLIIAR